MVRRGKVHPVIESQEYVVQRFPCRCPYCDQIISYDQYELKVGENEIECPKCKKVYIKIVADPLRNGEIG